MARVARYKIIRLREDDAHYLLGTLVVDNERHRREKDWDSSERATGMRIQRRVVAAYHKAVEKTRRLKD